MRWKKVFAYLSKKTRWKLVYPLRLYAWVLFLVFWVTLTSFASTALYLHVSGELFPKCQKKVWNPTEKNRKVLQSEGMSCWWTDLLSDAKWLNVWADIWMIEVISRVYISLILREERWVVFAWFARLRPRSTLDFLWCFHSTLQKNVSYIFCCTFLVPQAPEMEFKLSSNSGFNLIYEFLIVVKNLHQRNQ